MTLPTSRQPTADLNAIDTETLADQIALLSAEIQAATCRLLLMIAEFDRREKHGELGFVSCAHWLSWRTGQTLATARDKVRVARKLAHCPQITEAFAEGRISYSKVRALCRIVTPKNEQTLLEYALDGTASQLERIIRGYRQFGAAEKELTERQTERRYLSYHHDDDNMLVLSARLPPEVGALLVKALQIAAENTTEQPDAEPTQNLADVLGEVAAAALGEGLAHRAGKQRTADYQVLVHVDQNVLEDPEQEGRCHTEGAVSVSAETARRLTCDQPVLKITDAKHACHHHPNTPCPLNQGRSTRRPGPALQRAVRTRDQGVCQFPGCTHRHHLHLHHIKHWAEGGETSLNNMVLLCPTHHRVVHEGGFTIRRSKTGTLRYHNPQGIPLLPRPPKPQLPPEPVQHLLQQTNHQAPEITPWTPTPTWDGTYPVDYQDAVDWLQHLDGAS